MVYMHNFLFIVNTISFVGAEGKSEHEDVTNIFSKIIVVKPSPTFHISSMAYLMVRGKFISKLVILIL